MARRMKDSGVAWIGQVPEGWEVCKFKYAIHDSNSGEVIDKDWWHSGDELLFTCQSYPMKSNYPDFPESKRTRAGDILLTRNATPYIFIPPVGSIYSNVVQRVEIEKQFDLRFIKYNLECGTEAIVAMGDTIPSYNMELWKGIMIIKIPLPEQKRIAKFLDEKCGKIDELSEKVKAQIEKLEAYKKSLITEAVTKGVQGKRKMKDSGVAWIGQVPEEWEVKRLKYHFKILSGNGFKEELQGRTDGDLPVYKAREISAAEKYIVSSPNWITIDDAKTNGFNIINAGSILMPKIGEALKKNSRAIAIQDCCVDNNCQALIPLEMYGLYAYYMLKCIDMCWFDNAGTIPCVSNRKLLNSKVPLPSADEQEEIAEYLDRKCGKVDEIIKQRKAQLEKLGEYKKSLIYEYVTGKKEVAV